MKKIAIIRIRGKIGVKKEIKDTLNLLRLYTQQYCVIVNNTPTITGMLKKVKDYVTWGEINEEAFKELLKARGRLSLKNQLTEQYLKEKLNLNYDEFTKEFFSFKKSLKDIPGMKLFFKLKPPIRGYERKGIKTPFSLGGALGYRKDNINDLIKRML
jgi:large subunit ribosomal protein L30